MLTTPEYFPATGTPLTRFPADGKQVREFAEQLYDELGLVLNALRREEVEERFASTYLCVELDRDAVAELRAGGKSTEVAADTVRQRARVVDTRAAEGIFRFHLEQRHQPHRPLRQSGQVSTVFVASVNRSRLAGATVHDLLVGSQSAAVFRPTFALVDPAADMDQALTAMNAIAGCQDVFVTVDGTAASAVVGG